MYLRPMAATYFCTIQPHDTCGLLAQTYSPAIHPITTSNSGVDFNYIGPEYRHYYQRYYPAPTKISKSEANLTNALRMLWEQHVAWTRMGIISIIAGLPDEELVIKRLLRNPKDFEAALKPLYGDKIASKFSQLFENHLVIAAQLVKASKAGDKKAAEDAEKRWYANADEIAVLLSKINPYWSRDDWQTMLYKHLALTKSESVDILTSNYAKGITTYDEIESQALGMADMMIKGIVKQFPQNFTK